MPNLIKQLGEVSSDLARARILFTPIKERWYAWNNYARKESWYNDWFKENKIDDVSKTLAFKNYDVPFDKTIDSGYNYFSEYFGARKAIEDLQKELYALVTELWKLREEGLVNRKYEGYVDILDLMAAACNKTPEAIRQLVRRIKEQEKSQNES